MSQPSFEDKVLGCVDRLLGSLGESTMQATYWHMEHTYGLKRDSIPRRPGEFVATLEAMFGSGASILERMLVREVRSAFRLPGSVGSFEEAIRKAAERNHRA